MNSPVPPLPAVMSAAAAANAEPRPGRYRHYKGNEYRVVGLARHSETMEPLVVYQALYGEHGLWVRPAAMFNESIALAGGAIVPRFARLEPD